MQLRAPVLYRCPRSSCFVEVCLGGGGGLRFRWERAEGLLGGTAVGGQRRLEAHGLVL